MTSSELIEIWKESIYCIVSKKKNHHFIQSLIFIGMALAGIYILMREVATKHSEPKNIDKGNPYFQKEPDKSGKKYTIYESIIKPTIDRVFAFGGLIILLPIFAVVSIAIYIDDPGPVFFTQKRVGKNKHFFALHKFRSMKMSTPHDVPTHQLSNPEQYITRVGKILRKTSLDELPQIWDIFRGKMSIIGPRPALWNQEDLVEERDKYGANDIYPGLTGLAQIKGRDELEIPDKAKIDGEYTKILCTGGIKAAWFDIQCFFNTISSVLKSDGIVEGGTGEMQKDGIDVIDVGFEDYGYRKKFDIDKKSYNQKKVLITGAGSYIGDSFKHYATEHYGKNFTVDTVDMIGDEWRKKDFSMYDTVFHVAGIAHSDVENINEAMRKKYYGVNTELAIEVCQRAKKSGISQFILMSSMIVYGAGTEYGKKKVIDEHTEPFPANIYGDSKWQADKGVRKMGNEEFHVAVLRSPMIYGKGSKGNYPKLAKLARKLPFFPDVDNNRSMLYIDNLCEFLCLLILSNESGVYFPQNKEYTKTSDMVQRIRKIHGKNIYLCKVLNPVVAISSHIPGKIGRLVDKAFGSVIYDQRLSTYEGMDYHVVDLKDSILYTEK